MSSYNPERSLLDQAQDILAEEQVTLPETLNETSNEQLVFPENTLVEAIIIAGHNKF